MRCFQVQAKLSVLGFQPAPEVCLWCCGDSSCSSQASTSTPEVQGTWKNVEMIVVPSDINSPGAFLDFRVVALTKLPHAQE